VWSGSSRVTGTPHGYVVFAHGLSSSHCAASGEPIVRSSHMYVGQEVQAVTIRRQTTAQPAIPLDGKSHSAAPLRASISLSPFAMPSRPLHAASESHVGHQVPPLHVLSCSGCPTAAERSGRATFACIEQSLFKAVLHSASGHLPLHEARALQIPFPRPMG
jgi:hypothetical protein